MLTVETQDGGCWVALRLYSRIGTSIFIADAMPVLEPKESSRMADDPSGIMSGWWSPTPVPMNN